MHIEPAFPKSERAAIVILTFIRRPLILGGGKLLATLALALAGVEARRRAHGHADGAVASGVIFSMGGRAGVEAGDGRQPGWGGGVLERVALWGAVGAGARRLLGREREVTTGESVGGAG